MYNCKVNRGFTEKIVIQNSGSCVNSGNTPYNNKIEKPDKIRPC